MLCGLCAISWPASHEKISQKVWKNKEIFQRCLYRYLVRIQEWYEGSSQTNMCSDLPITEVLFETMLPWYPRPSVMGVLAPSPPPPGFFRDSRKLVAWSTALPCICLSYLFLIVLCADSPRLSDLYCGSVHLASSSEPAFKSVPSDISGSGFSVVNSICISRDKAAAYHKFCNEVFIPLP